MEEDGMAFGIGVKLHSDNWPAVNQLICSAVTDILRPPDATSVAYLWVV